MFPVKFQAPVAVFLLSLFHLNPAVSNNDAMPSPISCANCTICQYPCHPPPDVPSPTYDTPPPPPPPQPPLPPAEPEPLPVPVTPANCPPIVVQCCQFSPPPPNSNIYTPYYNESSSSSSFSKLGLLFSAMAPLLGLAAIL